MGQRHGPTAWANNPGQYPEPTIVASHIHWNWANNQSLEPRPITLAKKLDQEPGAFAINMGQQPGTRTQAKNLGQDTTLCAKWVGQQPGPTIQASQMRQEARTQAKTLICWKSSVLSLHEGNEVSHFPCLAKWNFGCLLSFKMFITIPSK